MSNTRKAFFALVLAAVSGVSLAQSATPAAPTGDPAGFAAHKQQELTRIAAHIQAAQTLQACVQSAADHAAIKSCHEAARAAMGHGRG
jgi:hypothetical protein